MRRTTLDALLYGIEHADGWVIHNLRHTGNSVYPSELIDCDADVRAGEKLLSCILQCSVEIHRTQWGWIAERK